jgi:ferredoxin
VNAIFSIQKKGTNMAELTNRILQNIAGPYYVDGSCIDCDMCRSTAPDFFKRDEEIGMSIVCRQPLTPQEHALAEEAKQGCPSDSIGNDGVLESATGKVS